MTTGHTTRTASELVRVVFSRPGGMCAIMAVVLGAVLAATYLSPWTYRSGAMLQATPPAQTSTQQSASTLCGRLSLFVVAQRELILSDHVLAAALIKADQARLGDALAIGPTEPTADDVRKFVNANAHRLADLRKNVRVRTHRGSDIVSASAFYLQVDWPEERELAGQIGKDSKLFAAERAQQFAENLLTSYAARRQALATTAQTDQSAEAFDVCVIAPPSRPAPDLPHRPVVWINVLAGILAGLVLALIYACVADRMDRSVRGAGDVERYVGLSVLASIPRFSQDIIKRS